MIATVYLTVWAALILDAVIRHEHVVGGLHPNATVACAIVGIVRALWPLCVIARGVNRLSHALKRMGL